MAEAILTYDSHDIVLSCGKNQKMKDICTNLSTKINVDINSLIFLYGESKLDFEKTFEETTKENRISIIVYNLENKEICPKCGRILNNKLFDDIISSNNNVNSSLKEIKHQIELIMTDIINKVDINGIINQLKSINAVINNIDIHIKNINNKLNVIKLNDNNIIKLNNNKEDEELLKNEITCIYNKQKDEIIY